MTVSPSARLVRGAHEAHQAGRRPGGGLQSPQRAGAVALPLCQRDTAVRDDAALPREPDGIHLGHVLQHRRRGAGLRRDQGDF